MKFEVYILQEFDIFIVSLLTHNRPLINMSRPLTNGFSSFFIISDLTIIHITLLYPQYYLRACLVCIWDYNLLKMSKFFAEGNISDEDN